MNIEDENQRILIEEMEAIKADILAVYNASGKRTSGEFENGLELKYEPNKATLFGYEYLAGRRAGKMPPIEAIEKWLEQKGIKPIESTMKISTLAYLIARKIAKEGTRKESQLQIYKQVITPQRIQDIMTKISQINVQLFVWELNQMLGSLEENQ
ncbi:hypothetical protein [Flavobacterium hibernum]|uniref:Uncharacterized protein n=1 Tax=Flavobacterium hibernum TaxID=37752 RepID=A0ABX4C0C9_9FLAO|nr:hypothetical protein [Flavobacterium hibernum]OXA85200.1 hypothetical protein B0A73_17785 [Flavobacterium hibernum]